MTRPRTKIRLTENSMPETGANDAHNFAGKACAWRVYALTYSLHVKSKKPSRGAPPACGPAAATRWTPREGRGRRKRAPSAKTGPDEPRCT